MFQLWFMELSRMTRLGLMNEETRRISYLIILFHSHAMANSFWNRYC
jgi:hypothetical protein